MESSKVPKPSGLKKPTQVTKTILPMDRMKANPSIFTKFNGFLSGATANSSVPLTRDLANLPSLSSKLGGGRAPSPDTHRTFNNRAKLRRSKSACDIREFVRPLKRTETTLAPIPAKAPRIANGTTSISSTFRSGLLANKTKPPPANDISNKNNSNVAKTTINRKPVTTTRPATAAKSTTTTALAGASKSINKRIPPYDYKARFLDLSEKHKTLKEKFDENKEYLVTLENLPEQYEDSQSQLAGAREELKNAQAENESLQRQGKSQVVKIASLTKCLQETKEELENLIEKYNEMQTAHEKMSVEVVDLREKTGTLSYENTELKTDLGECQEQLFQANMERKDLHNMVMDLRGNIRVFCRVRPPLDCEEDRSVCGWSYLDEATLEIANLEMMASGTKNKVSNHTFSFDHVFHPRSTQQDVFDLVSPLIQSALDGYNICIFAYGQTGSGKTFTMDGVTDDVGVIPRTVDLLFESIRNYKRLGWSYEIKATFLEIYNEVLYDLLSNDQKDMEIRMAKNKSDIYVSNITEETVSSANRLRQLMHIAKMNRATASTVGNERSSRSHAVTKIELIGTHEGKGEMSYGTINLVDLAGSESPKTSTRMNETKSINRSLSELTNVILALLQKQDHIPYRNSKLTHLLMPSLGGNSKTLMFINVAPFQDCFVESVKSLRFAASVNSCKLAKAKKNKFLNTSAAASTSGFLA